MGYIPHKEANLSVFALNLVKYGEDKGDRLKFDPQKLAELRQMTENFDGKRKNPLKSPHSALDMAAKDNALTLLEQVSRNFMQGPVNHRAAVSGIDRVGLGLPLKDHPAKARTAGHPEIARRTRMILWASFADPSHRIILSAVIMQRIAMGKILRLRFLPFSA